MIEHDVPLPAPSLHPRGRFREVKELEPGDSCTFPKSDLPSLSSLLRYYRVRHGWMFTRQVEGDRIRVWRILA